MGLRFNLAKKLAHKTYTCPGFPPKRSPLIETEEFIHREEKAEGSGDIRSGAVDSIELRNYRNYDALRLSLSHGFNIVAGPNAQGKTNLLEAMALLATTRVLRGQRDSEAILEGATSASVSAELDGGRTSVAIELVPGKRKRALLNGMALPRASDLIGRVPCVCVTAEDLAIVRGEPSDRRLFLDLELCSYSASYLQHFATYKRALEQRNALLRQARDGFVPDESFEVWEQQLADRAVAIRSARQAFVAQMAPRAAEAQQFLGEGERLSVAYDLNDEAGSADETLSELARTRASDIHRGGTSIGPHRDDLRIEVSGKAARLFGSQGQQRTAVIAIKMATLERAREQIGRPPLLLLDDILSDLDATRRVRLVEWVLAKAGQAVLTCTEPTAAGDDFLARARVFEVMAGKIRDA